jgi:serine phosphatase RsbU (regulator of sigma subunit)
MVDSAPGVSRTLRRISRLSIAVLVLGLLVTAAAAWVSYAINANNEHRLLQLQTKQTGTVLQVVLPTVQTPLASAAALAATSDGNLAQFQSYISSYVGSKGPFVSASLWKLDDGVATMTSVVGAAPQLSDEPRQAAAFFSAAQHTSALSVIGPLGSTQQRLGYAFLSDDKPASYAVYAESSLPADRRVTVQKGSPFSDLRFALYLGPSVRSNALLETNAPRLPVSGHTATVVVPFGANSLTLVAAANGHLGGALDSQRWWIIVLLGAAIAVVAAIVAERLVRRREAAERLTGEVRHLLGEQRSIAESLQQALLPQALPPIRGVETASRYIPGANGVDIGGDWYDIIPVGDQDFFFVIGDVSGRGVRAGTVMAALLFAIRAFISEGHPPHRILETLSGLLSVARDGHFATVLCGYVDVEGHRISFANAGHLPPLLITPDSGEFLSTTVGPPIGVPAPDGYRTQTTTVPPGATLIAYTDGLIERPRESLDDGLARLKAAAGVALQQDVSLDDLLATLVAGLAHDGHSDDTAILGVRWLS